MPRLRELYPGICLTTEEKARKNLSQGSRRMSGGTMETEYTEQSIQTNMWPPFRVTVITAFCAVRYCYLM